MTGLRPGLRIGVLSANHVWATSLDVGGMYKVSGPLYDNGYPSENTFIVFAGNVQRNLGGAMFVSADAGLWHEKSDVRTPANLYFDPTRSAVSHINANRFAGGGGIGLQRLIGNGIIRCEVRYDFLSETQPYPSNHAASVTAGYDFVVGKWQGQPGQN